MPHWAGTPRIIGVAPTMIHRRPESSLVLAFGADPLGTAIRPAPVRQ